MDKEEKQKELFYTSSDMNKIVKTMDREEKQKELTEEEKLEYFLKYGMDMEEWN